MREGRGSVLPGWMALVCGLLAALPARAGTFGIDLVPTGFTVTQRLLFEEAVEYWQGALAGTAASDDISLLVAASSSPIDGGGKVLGSASGFTTFTDRNRSQVTGFLYNTGGSITLDTDDLGSLEASGDLYDVILHELAHVIGFGDDELWTFYGVYAQGSYQYTGTHALAAYQAEFDPTATFVPVENGGGPATADAHWEEQWAGGSAELMTGFLNRDPFVSETTRQSFADIGFVVSEPVPLPAPALLFLSACAVAAYLRRPNLPVVHRSRSATM